nr:hypothetical protein [Streptacidiphilus anmyonensis]
MGPQAPGFRRLRLLGGVFVVVFLLVVAVAVINRTNGGSSNSGTGGGSTTGKSNDAGAQSAPTAPTGTQPVTTTSNGIGVQYPRTSEGAQSAAANYSVVLGSSEMYATQSRHAILQTLADPAILAGLESTSDSAYTSQNAVFGLTDGQAPKGQTFVSRTIPIGTKSDAYTGSETTVEVWCTSLGGLAGTGSVRPVTTYWFTETVKLRWINGDWKLASYAQQEGPVPVSGNQSVSNFDSMATAVTQFGGFRYAR